MGVWVYFVSETHPSPRTNVHKLYDWWDDENIFFFQKSNRNGKWLFEILAWVGYINIVIEFLVCALKRSLLLLLTNSLAMTVGNQYCVISPCLSGIFFLCVGCWAQLKFCVCRRYIRLYNISGWNFVFFVAK